MDGAAASFIFDRFSLVSACSIVSYVPLPITPPIPSPERSVSRHLLFAALVSLGLTACQDAAEVQMVKGGTLQLCPSKTVESMVNGFMGNPSWEAIIATDGGTYVNIGGDITYQDNPVRAKLQFSVNKSAGTFEFYAIELNDVAMPQLLAIGLMNKMCEEGGS
jgi:hypothetical protein